MAEPIEVLEQLTGRALDCAVATVVGYRWKRIESGNMFIIIPMAPVEEDTDLGKYPILSQLPEGLDLMSHLTLSRLPKYSQSTDDALKAYAVIRESGWRMVGAAQQEDGQFRVPLVRAATFTAWGFGSLFALALSRAIVAAGAAQNG